MTLPTSASASMCLPGGGPPASDYQRDLMPLISPLTPAGQPVAADRTRGADGAAREALGAQFGALWLDIARQGWSVAFSPGTLDATAARAAIIAALGTRFAPEQISYLDARLNVFPTPYSEADLLAVREQVAVISASAQDFAPAFGIGCRESDAYRVHVFITQPETSEAVARAQTLFGHFGDMVQLIYGWGGGCPVPGVARTPAAVNVGTYATLPKAAGCVRGRFVGVRAADDAALRSVTLTAGKRTVKAKPGKRARLALKSRSTRVTLTVSLRDARTATQTVTYRRCG